MKTFQTAAAIFVFSALAIFAQTATPATVQNVSPDQAATMLKERKDIVVIDLRTPDEFSAGHIPGATNIDFLGTDFAKKLEALDKSKTYLIHCASGNRSSRSLTVFEAQKFQTLFHLNTGFKSWSAAGKPVEK